MPGKGLPIASEGDHTPRHSPAPKGKEGFASDLPNLPGGLPLNGEGDHTQKDHHTPPTVEKFRPKHPRGILPRLGFATICQNLPN